MTKVFIEPMSAKIKSLPKWLRPGIPPVFQDIDEEGVTEDDRQLARELFMALDEESQDRYLKSCPKLFGGCERAK